MFSRFRRRVLELLDSIELETIGTRVQVDKANRSLRIVMRNQELLDNYAAQIAEQNSQIRAAFAVIVSEINKLQKAAQSVAEEPLDTSKIDAAIAQLTDAVDAVESLPTPVEEPAPADPYAPVEVAPEDFVGIDIRTEEQE